MVTRNHNHIWTGRALKLFPYFFELNQQSVISQVAGHDYCIRVEFIALLNYFVKDTLDVKSAKVYI